MRIQNDYRQNLKTMMIMRQFEHDIKELETSLKAVANIK